MQRTLAGNDCGCALLCGPSFSDLMYQRLQQQQLRQKQ